MPLTPEDKAKDPLVRFRYGATSVTPEVLGKLEKAFLLGLNIEEACAYAEISKSTWHYWSKQNPDLRERIDQLRLAPILKAKETVIGALDTPEIAFRYLERKLPDEFGPTAKIKGTMLHLDLKDVHDQIMNGMMSVVDERNGTPRILDGQNILDVLPLPEKLPDPTPVPLPSDVLEVKPSLPKDESPIFEIKL